MVASGERVENPQRVIALVEGASSGIAAEDLLDRLNTVGIPAGQVRTIDEDLRGATGQHDRCGAIRTV